MYGFKVRSDAYQDVMSQDIVLHSFLAGMG